MPADRERYSANGCTTRLSLRRYLRAGVNAPGGAAAIFSTLPGAIMAADWSHVHDLNADRKLVAACSMRIRSRAVATELSAA